MNKEQDLENWRKTLELGNRLILEWGSYPNYESRPKTIGLELLREMQDLGQRLKIPPFPATTQTLTFTAADNILTGTRVVLGGEILGCVRYHFDEDRIEAAAKNAKDLLDLGMRAEEVFWITLPTWHQEEAYREAHNIPWDLRLKYSNWSTDSLRGMQTEIATCRQDERIQTIFALEFKRQISQQLNDLQGA